MYMRLYKLLIHLHHTCYWAQSLPVLQDCKEKTELWLSWYMACIGTLGSSPIQTEQTRLIGMTSTGNELTLIQNPVG